MMRVFLTGSSGNAGQPTLKELLRRGYKVTALVRQPTQLPGCRTIVGDLGNIEAVADDAAAADAIIHLASPRDNDRDSVITDDIEGTAALLDAWRRGNFLYASSQTVYGVPQAPLTESSPIDALCWYDLGKVCNEFQLKMAEPEANRGAAVSLRLALLFAAGDRCQDRQFLPIVYQQIQRGAAFVFDSEEGLETYGSSFIGEEDCGRAVVDALDIQQPGPYNLAGGFCTWRSLIETINEHTGTNSQFIVRAGAEPRPGEYRLPQSRSYMETDALAAQTGFAPRQTLDELVRRHVTRYR